jgi:vesicle coat complex subunit
MFYKLYRDYIEATVERDTPHALRNLALAHYFSVPPKETEEVLKRLTNAALASEDFKTVAIALASLASVTTDEIGKFLPNC